MPTRTHISQARERRLRRDAAAKNLHLNGQRSGGILTWQLWTFPPGRPDQWRWGTPVWWGGGVDFEVAESFVADYQPPVPPAEPPDPAG